MRKWLLLLGLVVLVPLATLYGLTWFYDSEQIRAELSDGLTRALNRPVSIESVSLRFLPQPHLEVGRLRIQLDETRSPLTLGSASVQLDPKALFKGKWVIPALRLSDILLTPKDYAALSSLLKPAPDTASADTTALLPVSLKRIELRRITWIEEGNDFYGPFNAEVNLSDALTPTRARVATLDKALEIQLAWQGALLLFEAQAQTWQPPNEELPLVEVARFQGKLFGSRLVLDRGTARWNGLDITLSNGSFDWSEGLDVKADVGLRRLLLPVVLANWDIASVPGEFRNGNCSLDASGETWDDLIDALQMDCKAQFLHAGKSASMQIGMTTVGSNRRLTLQARDLQLPVAPPLQFDQLQLTVALNGHKARVERLEANAYGGELVANGELDWNAGWSLSFDADARGLDLETLLLAFDDTSLSGILNGRCQGQMAAAKASALFASREVNCDVLIRDGVVKNADLESAAKVATKQDAGSGDTPFEFCRAEVLLRPASMQLRDIAIRSNVLEGTGDIAVGDDNALDGQIKVAFKKTAGVVGVPLRVSGSLEDPDIMPTRSALAGGAAGTFMLGPGLGTAIGVKVGEVFGKLGELFKGKSREGAGPAELETRSLPSLD